MKIEQTELYRAMINRGDSPEEAKTIIRGMREQVEDGEDPEEVLNEGGFEPDYIFDII